LTLFHPRDTLKALVRRPVRAQMEERCFEIPIPQIKILLAVRGQGGIHGFGRKLGKE